MASLNHYRAGSGPPLLLIHGIGSRWQVWLPVLGELAAAREVVAIDLPGFGFSRRPAGVASSIAELTARVAGFCDELGWERPHVAGNSLGGWLSLELARGGRAASATALSPAGFYGSWGARHLHVSLWTAVRAVRTLRPFLGALTPSATVRRLALAQLAAHPERMPAFDAAENMRALADAAWFDETLTVIVRSRFAGDGEPFGVPVTIAWGEKDRLLLPGQAAQAKREIPGARSVTLRDCGHVPTWDDPGQVAAVILEGSASR